MLCTIGVGGSQKLCIVCLMDPEICLQRRMTTHQIFIFGWSPLGPLQKYAAVI